MASPAPVSVRGDQVGAGGGEAPSLGRVVVGGLVGVEPLAGDVAVAARADQRRRPATLGRASRAYASRSRAGARSTPG